MILLNKKNSAYIEGKRPKSAINIEGYQCLANQIREQAKISWKYSTLTSEHTILMSVNLLKGIIIILLVDAGFLYTSCRMSIVLILSLAEDPPKLTHILLNLAWIILPLLVPWFLFSLLYDFYISYRTKVRIENMQKLIAGGVLLSGHVEAIHIMHRAKRKVTGKRNITIEYAFTRPEGELLRGTFTTSKVKAVTSGDEVAVWYINEFLHILL